MARLEGDLGKDDPGVDVGTAQGHHRDVADAWDGVPQADRDPCLVNLPPTTSVDGWRADGLARGGNDVHDLLAYTHGRPAHPKDLAEASGDETPGL